MIVSVASGKGGTGKTTIATSLAAVLGSNAMLLDCDVEEPNCHLFMNPEITTREEVTLPVPAIDAGMCTLCEKCAEVCQYSAIVVIGDQVLTFPELCHGCGGCSLLCPEGAIREEARPLGILEAGYAGDVEFVHGIIRIGEAMSPPLIKAVKKRIRPEKTAILDCPPGASCPVITAVNGSDFILMVTEPTPFGLHDLRIAVEAVSPLAIPLGVILNRSDIGDEEVQRYCNELGVPVLMEIPFDRAVAEAYSRGRLLVDCSHEYRERFEEMFARVKELAGSGSHMRKEAAL